MSTEVRNLHASMNNGLRSVGLPLVLIISSFQTINSIERDACPHVVAHYLFSFFFLVCTAQYAGAFLVLYVHQQLVSNEHSCRAVAESPPAGPSPSLPPPPTTAAPASPPARPLLPARSGGGEAPPPPPPPLLRREPPPGCRLPSRRRHHRLHRQAAADA